MKDKEILVKLDHDRIRGLVPTHPKVIIEHLFVGSSLSTYTYNADVNTWGPGWVTGGGSRTRTYRVFDIGLAVVNTASSLMRVEMILSKVDGEGYTVEDKSVWADVGPGEKRRLWAELNLQKKEDLRNFVIKAIGVAVPGAAMEASSQPMVRIHELLVGSESDIANISMLDSLGVSIKDQKEVRKVARKGLSLYLTYVKWATIVMLLLLVLGAVGLAVIYFRQSG